MKQGYTKYVKYNNFITKKPFGKFDGFGSQQGPKP